MGGGDYHRSSSSRDSVQRTPFQELTVVCDPATATTAPSGAARTAKIASQRVTEATTTQQGCNTQQAGVWCASENTVCMMHS